MLTSAYRGRPADGRDLVLSLYQAAPMPTTPQEARSNNMDRTEHDGYRKSVGRIESENRHKVDPATEI